MKRVSYKIAKALKAAGYPQDVNYDRYVTEPCKGRYLWYTPSPNCTSKYDDNDLYDFEEGEYVDHKMYNVSVIHSVAAPTYLEAWLWLWREKKIYLELSISIEGIASCEIYNERMVPIIGKENNDPEGAIAAAIEDLVDNDLIK